jgi:hypothetical protein
MAQRTPDIIETLFERRTDMGHHSNEYPWIYGPQTDLEIEEEEARRHGAEVLAAGAHRAIMARDQRPAASTPLTLTMAETVERLRYLHADVVRSAARHGQAPQGSWQQENLEAIARRLQAIIELYEEEPLTAPPTPAPAPCARCQGSGLSPVDEESVCARCLGFGTTS